MGRGTNGREMSVNSTNKSVPLRRVFCQLSTLTVVLRYKAPMIIFQSADFGLTLCEVHDAIQVYSAFGNARSVLFGFL